MKVSIQRDYDSCLGSYLIFVDNKLRDIALTYVGARWVAWKAIRRIRRGMVGNQEIYRRDVQ